MANAAEIGRYLAVLRDQAGFKQVELAKRVTWSPAVLSRVESGERPVTEDELGDLLAAIGTKEARAVAKILSRQWDLIPEPQLGHPDQELLWSAEVVAGELRDLRNRPDFKHAFERRQAEYMEELVSSAGRLLAQDYQIAFIGNIGVGKSTAICKLTGLEVQTENESIPSPVLEAGGGGVTICEVHLRQGPEYGLMIEPRTEDEIRRDVLDFAEFFIKPLPAGAEDDSEFGEGESSGLSKEIARAVRNMSGLQVRREKGLDGKMMRRDEAKELATKYDDPRTLAVEILALMQLHRRDRRDAWYTPATGKKPLQWLKETFELINNGRHPEFSLPKRIDMVVKEPIVGVEGLSIRLVDTKGIDQTGERADLECHFDAPQTITVLCSYFNEAPAPVVQSLLTRAREAGVRNLSLKASILALARPAEALAVKDDAGGMSAKSIDEGYDLKREQVEMQLQRRGLGEIPVGFFNAREDAPEVLRIFLVERIKVLQEWYRNRLKEVVGSARNLLKNYEKEQVQEVLRDAAHRLVVWLSNNDALGKVRETVHDSLLNALAHSYAATIRATVNRYGGWHNLDYGHHLGFGARRIAATASEKKLEGFKHVAANVLQDGEMADAKELVEQAVRVMEASIDELLRRVQLMGQSIYSDVLKGDQSFWQACAEEWGRGKGYRDRVSKHNDAWFAVDAHVQYEGLVRELLEREWKQVLERMRALCHVDAEAPA